MPTSSFAPSNPYSRTMDKENGYVFEDVDAEDDDDDDDQYHNYEDCNDGETATDFIVDNLRMTNDVFRRQSQSSYSSGHGRPSSNSTMTNTSNNIISQYSVNNSRKNSTSRTSKSSSTGSTKNNNKTTTTKKSSSLEDQYSNAMNRMSRSGDYYFEPMTATRTNSRQSSSSHSSSGRTSTNSGRPPMKPRDDGRNVRNSHSSSRTSNGSQGSSNNKKKKKSRSKSSIPASYRLPSHKLPVSGRDPSEEVLALFGVHGVTGHYFLQLALEAGYKQVRCLVLPGMTEQGFAEDFVGAENLKLIVGTLDDTDKVQRVIKNASYVVCLFNDTERSVEQPDGTANPNLSSSSVGSLSSSSRRTKEELPSLHTYYDRTQQRDSTGSAKSNGTESSSSSSSSAADYPHLRFMESLVPLLSDNNQSESAPKCRVLLYQASSSSVDERGNAPIIGQVVKKLQFSKTKRHQLKEQDRVVKYISETTREMSMNFIVTRPGDLVWDRPSRKKLSSSKSLPGPFPITNVDLAEFTLGALRTEKIYNTCPYVVQDGI